MSEGNETRAETRAEIIDKLIKILDLYRNKEGFIKYTLLLKILEGFKRHDPTKLAPEEPKDI